MTQKYVECGCCGHYHRVEWYGDCREDSERFSLSYLEDNDLTGEFDENLVTIEEQ